MATQSLINEYLAKGGTENVTALSDDELMAKLEELYAGPQPTFIQDLMTGTTAAADSAKAAEALGAGLQPYEITPYVPTEAASSDDELITQLATATGMQDFAATGAVDEAGMHEQRMRDVTQGRSFIDNLSDPETAAWVSGRLGKQAAASAVNTLDLPAQFAGMYGLGALGAEELTNLLNGDSEKPNFGSGAALDYANEHYMEALEAMHVTPPRNVEESLASIAGMMIPIPGPKVSGPMNLLEIATPFVVGGNLAPRMAANFATAAVMDQGIRELTDVKGDQYETVFDMMNMGDNDSEIAALSASAAMAAIPFWGLPMARTFASVRNPAPTLKAISDIDRLGPSNLYSITKNSDVLGGYVLSDTDSVIEIARRAGIPNIDDLQKQFDATTQSAASGRVTEGLATGKMPTVHANFNAPVSPRQLASVFDLFDPKQQVDVNNYLLLGNYADVIKRRASHDANAWANYQKALAKDPNAPRPAMIAKPGDAAELAQITATRGTLRANMPMLDEYSKGFQQLTEEARRFISEGPYALIDKQTKARFDKEQPHYVPMSTNKVDPNEDLLSRMVDARREKGLGDQEGWLEARDIADINMGTLGMQEGALPSIINYTSSLLHAQMKNNAKAAYVDAMLQSVPNQQGKPLIRLATKKELAEPANQKRIIDVVRQGKHEQYITESYIARTLQLDPYVLTNPIAMGLYATKRAFETGTTGVASVTFPFTSAIRDTLSGWANTKGGKAAPGWGVITAPVEILGAKAFKAFYQNIDDHLAAGKPLWLPGMDEAAQKQLSARLASTYQNTFYHLAQEHGGYDASIMTDRIRLAQGQLGEIIKTIPRPISKTYGVTIKPMLAGMSAILEAMLEAPRYNAAKRGLAQSGDIEDALGEARKMTGDTSKSGRVYDKSGLITGDVVDKGSSIANPLIGGAIEFGRVATPYFNPMIKGMQRVVEAAAADPVRFAARNWLAVGLPATVGYAWNTMLSQDNEEGYDYIDYQFNRRSSTEQVMEIYIAIPGLPPERGLSIPIAHESTPFMAPFLTYLQHMGASGEEIQKAMTQTGLSILEQSAGIGLPPSVNAFLNWQGISGVDTLIGGGNSAYDTREDNVGILPQNIENAIRSQFGTQAAIGLEAASAFMDDFDIRAGVNEYMNSIAKRMPVTKGLGGWRTNSAYFTPISSEQRRKLDAYNAFDDAWVTHFDREGVVASPSSPPPRTFPDENGDPLEVLRGNVGPQPTVKPVNPLYELFGQQIHDTLAKKDPYGFPATKAQMGALTEQVRLLKGWNAGRADDYAEWQKTLNNAGAEVEATTAAVEEIQTAYDDLPRGAKTTTPEGRALKEQLEDAERKQFMAAEMANTARFIEEEGIDLGNRFDVIRLTNIMEKRRVDLMKYQLSIIEQVEADLTMQLQAQGLMSPQDHFRFEKHLEPTANPGLEEVRSPSPAQVPTGQGAAGLPATE